MNKELYNRKTEEGWKLLNRRIEKEQMLDKAHLRPSSRLLFRFGAFVAAASIISFLIVAAWYFMQTPQQVMRSVTNADGAISLVKTLADGSIVYIGSHSSLQYPDRFEANRRIVSLHGNAFFEVAHNKACPFYIRTDQALVEVVGTSFNVLDNHDKSFVLMVRTGVVKVNALHGGASALVRAGQTLLLYDSHMEVRLSNTKMSFLAQSFRFKDETLYNIVRAVNSRLGEIKLSVAPSSRNRRLTVTFDNETPIEMAQLISEALHLQYTTVDKVITIH